MRYNLESTLPINAFSPRGGRNNPFVHGMTLEGGGGGAVGKAIGSVAKAVTGAVKGVVQPVYNATLKNIPGVDQALVGLDKSVSNSIPGGWGTIASVAASFIPGAQLAAMGLTQTGLMTGLGALTGSGVMRKGNQFNLQGALMGGAAAYGMSNLAQGLQAAGGGGSPTVGDVAAQLGVEGASTAPGSQAAMLAEQASGMGSQGLSNIASSAAPAIETAASQGVGSLTPNAFAYTPAGEMVPSGISPEVTGAVSTPLQAQPSGLSNLATQTGIDSGAMGQGIKNLSGLSGGEGTAAAARAAFSGSGATMTNTALPIVMGGMGLADLEAQKTYLDQQLASNNLAQNDYNSQVAEIDRQIEIARQAIAANPFNTNPDRSATMDPTSYARTEEQSNLYDRAPSNLYPNQPSLSSTFTAARGGIVPGYWFGGTIGSASNLNRIIGQLDAEKKSAQEQDVGMKATKESPWNTNPDRSPQNLGSTMMPKNIAEYLQYEQDRRAGRSNYAVGGSVDDESGMDEARGLSQGNMTNGFMGGGISRYAQGGQPRFLSGGGDGMSDSIPASINGKQEARLADGEFVIPADVVSHLGNGSSKAGAKRLYSMMDKVRSARTGTKKQGKQINPGKYLPA